MSQTTVARRIAALEEALGLTLFEKRQAGYALTPAGEGLVDRAQASRSGNRGLRRSIGGVGRDTSGVVRITTQEIFANTLLGPILRELHELHPEIVIEIDTQQELLDLGARRGRYRPSQHRRRGPGGTVGRSLCIDDWTLYCSREYADRHGVPTHPR